MIIGNKKEIAFDIKKVSNEDHTTRMKLFIHGKNICEWIDKQSKDKRTIVWNLDDLVCFLNDTVGFLTSDDSFPYRVDGECASEMENNARDFDCDDEEKFNKYYDTLNDWVYRHSWNHAGAGAILPDVIFRTVDGKMEISWWDDDSIDFTNTYGFVTIDGDKYSSLIDELFEKYNALWD